MRVALLGATGVAGRAFVSAASARGHTLVTRRVDLFDADALAALLRGCDAVVNLVTSIPKPGGRGDWKLNDRIRREGTMGLLQACSASGVQTLVQQSVAMLHNLADDRPQSEDSPIQGYGVLQSAFDMEELVRASPLDWRLIRGGLFYGAGTLQEQRWHDEVSDDRFRLPCCGAENHRRATALLLWLGPAPAVGGECAA